LNPQEITKLCQGFARELKAHGAAGMCLILVPVETLADGVIHGVQIECAGGTMITPQVIKQMLAVAMMKVSDTPEPTRFELSKPS
jgi:hypothetical protein